RCRVLAKPGPDQRQIGRAASDVDEEDQMHAAELRLQIPAVDARPVVKRGLRLLQQNDVWQTRFLRRAQGQGASALVEGSGNGDDEVLLAQRSLGVRAGPGISQVPQDARARSHRREPRHVRGCSPRQDLRGAVDRGMAEPALRGSDVPSERRCTGSTSPALPSAAGKVVSMPGSSSSSSTSSRIAPATSSRRALEAKNRKDAVSPTTAPTWSCGRSTVLPSSMPNGARQTARTGAANPGTAGAAAPTPT